MKIFGLDFTSAPSPAKPIVCATGLLSPDGKLRIERLDFFTNFEMLETFLAAPGPWVSGFDFPFGQPLPFLEYLNLPLDWSAYVETLTAMDKKTFEKTIETFKKNQPIGKKEPLRLTDSLARAQSPLKLVRTPTAKMFYEGARRLAAADVSIPPCRPLKSNRIAIETYPALLARRLFSGVYKSNLAGGSKALEKARLAILTALRENRHAPSLDLQITLDEDVLTAALTDHEGDCLDAVLCAVLAAWSARRGRLNSGIPDANNPTLRAEGWIAHPFAAPARAHRDSIDAVELERTRRELQALRYEIKRLSNIERNLSGEKDSNAFLEMIISEARNITNADGGTLYLLERGALHFKAVQNHSLRIRMGGTSGIPITFPPVELKESNVSAYAAMTGGLVNIPDVYNYAPFDFTGPKRFDAQTGYRTKSMLVAPMKNHRNEVVGVLQLINARDPNDPANVISFSADHVSLIESLTSQAAITLTNTLLIEETRRATAMLRESEARARAIMDYAPDGIIVLNQLGLVESFNAAADRIFGYKEEEITGQKFSLLLAKPYSDQYEQLFERQQSGDKPPLQTKNAEVMGLRKGGELFPMDLRVSKVLFGESHLFSVIFRDISERKAAEKQLLLLSRALESTADAIVITNPQGLIQSVNPAFTHITGYTQDDVVGQTNRILKSEAEDPHIFDDMWKTITRGHVWKGRLTNRRKDGAQYYASLTVSPILSERGICEGYIGVQRDETAARQAEMEILSANSQLALARDQALEANKTKSRFLANMSHELRTPLNAIIGYSEILLEELQERGLEHCVADIKKIHGAGRQLLELISDILDLAKIEAGKMEIQLTSFCISDLIREVEQTIYPLAQQTGNAFEVICQEALGDMVADFSRVRQMLLNLLSNACKFTENGKVLIAAKREKRAGDQLDWISFEVSDTGIGMNPEQMSRLFDEFTQVHSTLPKKFGSTGLGLAISRRFCRMMGGDIQVQSIAGKGSVFTVRLPEKVVPPRVAPRREVTDPITF